MIYPDFLLIREFLKIYDNFIFFVKNKQFKRLNVNTLEITIFNLSLTGEIISLECINNKLFIAVIKQDYFIHFAELKLYDSNNLSVDLFNNVGLDIHFREHFFCDHKLFYITDNALYCLNDKDPTLPLIEFSDEMEMYFYGSYKYDHLAYFYLDDKYHVYDLINRKVVGYYCGDLNFILQIGEYVLFFKDDLIETYIIHGDLKMQKFAEINCAEIITEAIYYCNFIVCHTVAFELFVYDFYDGKLRFLRKQHNGNVDKMTKIGNEILCDNNGKFYTLNFIPIFDNLRRDFAALDPNDKKNNYEYNFDIAAIFLADGNN